MKEFFCSRWHSVRLASLFHENSVKNEDFQLSNALQFRYGSIVQKKKYDLTSDLIETYKKYTLIQPGDIMINGLNLNYDFITQRVALVPTTGIITSAYICLRPRNSVNYRFYTYYLKALDSIKVFNGLGTGIRLTLSYDSIKNMVLPLPPREEQDQIVRYLDWQVSKINRLIAAKQYQIELLEQKKKCAIQEAFCKTGSYCNIEQLLDTIREWLPEGWKSPLLGQVISSIEQGWSPNAGDDIDDPNQWHVLTLSAVKHGSFVKTACKPIETDATIPVYLELKDGNLLLTRSNTRNLVGDVCIVHDADPHTIFSDLIYRLVVKPEYARSRYLMYYLLSPFARIQIERAAKGSSGTMPKLSHADIRRIRIVLPSMEIQESICNELDEISEAIDIAIDRINTQITHIFELRTRLIFDVVTGQVDVRGIEVPEYEEYEEVASDDGDGDDIEEQGDE